MSLRQRRPAIGVTWNFGLAGACERVDQVRRARRPVACLDEQHAPLAAGDDVRRGAVVLHAVAGQAADERRRGRSTDSSGVNTAS